MLIVGLGNPGKKYEDTRHNVGFWAVDELVCSLNGCWQEDKKLESCKARLEIEGKVCTVLKPQTFMNLSGESVARYYKWSNEDLSQSKLIVVHDELDFDCGVVKLKKGGSAGGHRGIESIISKTGEANFYRLRVGIGHPRKSSVTPLMEVSDWVLRRPPQEEYELLAEASKFSAEVLKHFVSKSENEIRNFMSKRKG